MTNVVACIDGSDASSAVSDYAAWASLRLEAPLEFLHVLDKTAYPVERDLSGSIGLGSREELLGELANTDEKLSRQAMELGRAMLDAARQKAIADGVAEPKCTQRHGILGETLVEMGERIRLLILANHTQNHHEHLGSHLEEVVRKTHRPTLITPAEFKAPQRILICFDGSDTTRKAVEMVADSPLFRGISCHLLMVGEASATHKKQLSWAQTTLEAAGFDAPVKIMDGDIEAVLTDYVSVQGIDMLVMGAYRHSVLHRFILGSTTTSIIRKVSIPVLLL
ncbi:MAG: nucleotide-binding universal stress UspA family protein [Motiliproteus sp.]|jgi:nucleotide-binding universal stress UspA family protein